MKTKARDKLIELVTKAKIQRELVADMRCNSKICSMLDCVLEDVVSTIEEVLEVEDGDK